MAEGSSDPPDLNPDETPHVKPNQNKFRRGRPRHNSDTNLSNSNSYDLSQPHGHFHQGFKPQFNHPNYAERQHPPYRGEDGASWRGRGRGKREGNRNLNGSFTGSAAWRQRPGGDSGPYSGSNRGMGGYQSDQHAFDGPGGTNWRRQDLNKNVKQNNEDQDMQVKNPRKFCQEQRRGEQIKKGSSVENQRSDVTKEETQSSGFRERTQRNRRGPDPEHDDHQRKHNEAKRRQGPIKPPKPQSQDEVSSEKGASGQDGSDHGRPSQDPACKPGKGSGRYTALQARGGKRHTTNKTGKARGTGTRYQRAKRHRQGV
ncbi:hypothetical protein Q5P01_004244 [Channa striata]|uniref:Uncharacterized protein n=1 Tax=Channa striata TaxID=64152 RepID=A0AA88NHC3_CHASR|nr:hypothetical protein Q5P01_004244 [Channa striata]